MKEASGGKSWKPEGNILGVKGPMLFNIFFLSMFFHSYMELGDNELLGNTTKSNPYFSCIPCKMKYASFTFLL